MKYEFLTNNCLYRTPVPMASLVEGGAWDVLVRVRDRVHAGWRLLTHPLYGNFQPNQQPFRSVLLSRPAADVAFPAKLDADSVNLLEDALAVYRKYEKTRVQPGDLPESVERDFAIVDISLLHESLDRYGLWKTATLQECIAGVSDPERR